MKKKVTSLVLVFAIVLLSVSFAFAASTYTVKSGDLLWKIAKANNTTWQILAEINKLENPNLILPNQVLKLGEDTAAADVPVPKADVPVPKADVVTSASVVDTEAAFEKSISKDGKWIICTTKDLTFTKELVVDGAFKNGKKDVIGDLYQRKIALYTQDDKRNVTGRFTLTAPRITFNSPFGSLEHGTFKGDVYVSAEHFKLVDQIVEGSIYFTSDAAMVTFVIDDKSKVTGRRALMKPVAAVDVVTSASLVNKEDAFEKAISKDGKWIIATLKDLTFTKELVVDGTFKNGKKDASGNELYQRKIAPYTQDDKHNVTGRFSLTAPRITFNSPFGSLEHGTFKGDVYVSADNFKLVDQLVEGNIYFTTDSAMATFKIDDKSIVTGRQVLMKPAAAVDVVTSASLVNTENAFEKAISKDGKWIIATLKDLTFTKELVVDGTFKNGKKDASGNELYQRKIAPYTQDDKHTVTGRFTLTAPRITFNSPFGSLEHGTFKGDVYVSADNFKLVDQVVEGNIYFTTDTAMATFKIDDKSKVTGRQVLMK